MGEAEDIGYTELLFLVHQITIIIALSQLFGVYLWVLLVCQTA